jgi:hypothetical protein
VPRSLKYQTITMVHIYGINFKSISKVICLTAACVIILLYSHTFFYSDSSSEKNERLTYKTYKLDRMCTIQPDAHARNTAAKAFQDIYRLNLWPSNESKSGWGSEIKEAIEWIAALKHILTHYDIRYVADIPCGDTNWQFASREMNTLPFYFGGDIAVEVVNRNQELYRYHQNKLFLFWDFVSCPLPRFSITNERNRSTTNHAFDLVIMRDALQHINILDGLLAVKNIIFSGSTYFLVSTFPDQCVDICRLGNITNGGFYHNNINCPPFNFPPPLFKMRSHVSIKENDEIHLYKIDDILKDKAKRFDQSCR